MTTTKYFRTWRDAKAFAKNAGLRIKPTKKRVWIDLAWERAWSITLEH